MNIKAGSCALRTVHTIVILVATLFSAATPAVVNVDITRAIINAGEKSVPLSLDNSGDQPMLVQVWVDEGNPGVSPDKVKTPVVILPPVFRMSPGEERSVKFCWPIQPFYTPIEKRCTGSISTRFPRFPFKMKKRRFRTARQRRA